MERYNMTRKQYLQDLENSVAIGIFNSAMEEYSNKGSNYTTRLRSCQAEVIVIDNYYILKSYETFIVAIDRRTHKIADVLRHVYCFTRTSAQHISKFIYDYTPYPWNSDRYTFRDI